MTKNQRSASHFSNSVGRVLFGPQTILLFALLPSVLPGAPATNDDDSPGKSLAAFLAEGTVRGQTGVGANVENDRNGPNPGLSWAYLEAGYATPFWNGFSAGAGFLAVGELWENHPGDYSDVFTEPFNLQELYLEYRNDNQTLWAFAGRKTMPYNPGLDGDYHQGINLHAGTENGYSLDLSAFDRWIKYSTYNYDLHGVTGWDDVDEAYPGAAEVFFAAVAQVPLGENFKISPYLNYQQDVMLYYGATFDSSIPTDGIAKESSWQSQLILALYDNLVSASIEPEYEDAWGGLFHTGLVLENYAVGGGIYWISDDTIDTGAGAFHIFDPLKEDNLYPLNDQNDFILFYLNGSATFGNLTIEPALGIGHNSAVDSDSLEINLLFDYQLPGNFELAGYVVYVEFEKSDLPNYSIVGATIGYNF